MAKHNTETYQYGFFGPGGLNIHYNAKDKDFNILNDIKYMLSVTHKIFAYDGLPEEINKRMLEIYLQCNGSVGIIKYTDNKYYALPGTLGGVPDAYYMPTEYIIANPALKDLKPKYNIGKDVIVIRNDTMYMGLLPLLTKYASEITETELSLHIANINTRLIALMSAPNDTVKAECEKVLQQLDDGVLGVVGDNQFFDGIKVQPYSEVNNNIITQLIELNQYLKASRFNAIGLNSNYNMKREAINTEESQLNHDALLPFIDDMLESRQDCFDEFNKVFGENVTVSLTSAWEENHEEETEEETEEERKEDDDN